MQQSHSELETQLIVPIAEAKINKCIVDSALTIYLSDHHKTVIRIEGPFAITTDEQEQYPLPNQPHNLDLFLVDQIVNVAWVLKSGELRVRFNSGVFLTVHADPYFEAWEIWREDGFRVICMPSGELAIWTP